ncbi:MAG: exopolyphosphatase [Rhizobiales bacterium 63-7]|nr:MAG: exopolyphosphatase [Rhizobiales bacterium 63-7]
MDSAPAAYPVRVLRGDRIKNVTDPERGPVPLDNGASATGRKGSKSSRRGKKKRHGAPRDASAVAKASPLGAAEAAARPTGAEPAEPVRKRKRRRRSKSGEPGQAAQVQSRSVEPKASEPPKPEGERRHKRRARGGKKAQHARPLAPVHMPAPPTPASVRPKSGRPDGPQRPDRDAQEARAHHRDGEPVSDDLYAALDLGTNNCRLLIAQPTRPGQFRVVDAFSRIVRLGEGLGASGRLSDAAMERAVEALRVCAVKLKSRQIRRMRLIATEACRAAENGEEFLSRVTTQTGLNLEIINRETEARLAVSGCSSLVGRDARSVVLFDIGGGSSEIAVLRIGDNRSPRLANHITHWTSLPVGVVTLSERHGGRDVSPDIFEAMVSEVEGMLARFDCPSLDSVAVTDDFYLIGTSGTVTTLAGVHLDLPRYDRRRVDGLWLSNAEVSEMQARLLSWDFAGRAANPCIGPDRADLVLAGCAILEAIRRRWPSKRMRVADRGLREGLLTDMMADDGVWRRNRQRSQQMRRDGASRHP